VPPAKIAELKGLQGDSGDNIPGVKGVGPKVALDLVKKHGSLATILELASELSIEPDQGETKAKHAKRIRDVFGSTISKLSRIKDQEFLALASYEAGKIRRDIELEFLIPRPGHDLGSELEALGASPWLLSRVEEIVR
jgi:DNA polymerase-1